MSKKYKIGDYAEGGIIASVDTTGTSGLVYFEGLTSPNMSTMQIAKDTIADINDAPGYSNWTLPSMLQIIPVYNNLFKAGFTLYITDDQWNFSTTPGNAGGGSETVFQMGIFTKKELLMNMQGVPTREYNWFMVRTF